MILIYITFFIFSGISVLVFLHLINIGLYRKLGWVLGSTQPDKFIVKNKYKKATSNNAAIAAFLLLVGSIGASYFLAAYINGHAGSNGGSILLFGVLFGSLVAIVVYSNSISIGKQVKKTGEYKRNNQWDKPNF